MINERAPLVLLLLIACLLHPSQGLPNGRILGGEDASSGQFPWAASLRVKNVHTCVATIISETYLLTAAHCVSQTGLTPLPLDQINVRVGSINQHAGGSIVSVKEVLIHPSYGNFLHDIAILTLSVPLTFNEKVNKVALPESEEEEGSGEEGGEGEGEGEAELPNGTPVHVAGWGELLSGGSAYYLQSSTFQTLSSHYCELAAGYGYESVLCLESGERQGVCRGDAGAPVVDDQKTLQGLVSFHFGNCGTTSPDVASRIVYYKDWINNNTQ
ncbi:chymotrypsin-1 [Scaptodrosophila lebanonensis]|uniref:trypsin n=1 Tax=Drosophila lebanonensis TaxID=7225 RepID=A0A6J2U2V2_DROLE|nr:chymotrypsin-1 [Scaptodrosophila lebanonensis]